MGKDACVSWLPEWFLYCFGGRQGEHALVPTTSASGRQIDTLWRELGAWSASSLNGEAFDLLTKEMRLKDAVVDGEFQSLNHNKAVGFKAASQKVMESFHAPHLLYLMTEARACEDWAYLSMYKACTGRDNRIVIQSVPGEETGQFHAICCGKIKGWEIFHWPAAKKVWLCPICDAQQSYEGVCSDCKADMVSKYVPTSDLVTQASINEKLEFGEESEWFQAPVLANFITGSSLALISINDYLNAESRYGELVEAAPDVLGCDIAWTGQNYTVLCHRKGPVLYKFHRWQGERTTYTSDFIISWMNAYPSGVMSIEGGIAQSGVIDQIIKAGYGHRMITINPGGPPVGTTQDIEVFFADRRSQLYYYLKERFKKGMIAIKDEKLPLMGQLLAIKAKIRPDEKFQIESKKELLKKMPSPDDGDAAMLTMAASQEASRQATLTDLASFGDRTSYDHL